MPDITSLTSFDGNGQIRDVIPCHPLGVKPSGNALLASNDLRTTIGTFQLLPDDLILNVLEFLDGHSLLRVGRACRALYAFTRAEDLWKTLFIEYAGCYIVWYVLVNVLMMALC